MYSTVLYTVLVNTTHHHLHPHPMVRFHRCVNSSYSYITRHSFADNLLT